MTRGEMARSVVIAKPTGFCSGVERAIRMAKQGKERYGRVRTLGELVHNPQVLEELKAQGIGSVRRVDQARDGALIIRAHGCPPEVVRRAEGLGVKVIDATCPYVRKVQSVARRLAEQGYAVVVVGERHHPEVRSILGHSGRAAKVYSPKMRIDNRRIGVVAQTTMSPERLQEAVANLSRLRYTELRVFDTICGEVISRQKAAAAIAEQTELVIVVGGRTSANTSRLAEIVKAVGRKMIFAECAAELPRKTLLSKQRIGVVAGSSTPAWVVREVAEFVRNPV